MIRKFNTLGGALATVLVLIAIAPLPAYAQFTTNGVPVHLSGGQTTALKFTAGSGVGAITCTVATSTGGMGELSHPALPLIPTYSGCTDSLGRTVHVSKNTIAYVFTSGGSKGTIDVNGELVTTVTGSTHCTITTKAQFINGATYTSFPNGTYSITTNTNNIHSSISGGLFACGTSSTTSTSGTLTGTMHVTGAYTGNARFLSVH